MAFYRQAGTIPRKRHTQHRRPDGSLYYEELISAEGFAADSSLLYHEQIPAAIVDARPWALPDHRTAPNEPLLPRHLRLHELFGGQERHDVVTGRRLVLGNADVRISYVVAGEASPLYRNALGDECVYVESGSATVQTVFGPLQVGTGDYVVLPRATTHRWVPDEPVRAYCIEASSHITPPPRYLSRFGQFLEHAPYCERDLRGPDTPVVAAGVDVEVLVKHRGGGSGVTGTVYTYPRHPFDVVGWDGCLYPYAFNVADFESITGRIHQPPPAHQVFAGTGFVICNFVPRKVDYHPLAVPVPYYHCNVDSDEVMFYCSGDYEARKGSGIGPGSISLHPGGHTHGPQPGAIERSLGVEFFDELAVMVDTFHPLELGEGGVACEDPAYPWSWSGRGPTVGGSSRAANPRLAALEEPPTWAADQLDRRTPNHPFSLHTLPYGVFVLEPDCSNSAAISAVCLQNADESRVHVGVAVGDAILDLTAATAVLLPEHAALFRGGSLDALLAAGRRTWTAIRSALTRWLTDERHAEVLAPLLVPATDVAMRLPFTVADYVDFSSCEQHVINAGRLLRPGRPAPAANWRHLPVGYHGRAGTVVVSGTPVNRPHGQRRLPDGTVTFEPSTALDFEAEVGFVVGTPSAPGSPVGLTSFADHVLGLCLINDWSARDIQAWESVPLGPLLGKSFATSVSPWLVPLDALSAARIQPPVRDPRPLPYLDDTGTEPWGLDITLEVRLNGQLISRPPFAGMYWTPAQQLAHLTSNGTGLRTGDLFASGTVSGAAPDQRGSLLELSWNGSAPLAMPDGHTRGFLCDGDEVSITATAPGPAGTVIGLGKVNGRVNPLVSAKQCYGT